MEKEKPVFDLEKMRKQHEALRKEGYPDFAAVLSDYCVTHPCQECEMYSPGEEYHWCKRTEVREAYEKFHPRLGRVWQSARSAVTGEEGFGGE